MEIIICIIGVVLLLIGYRIYTIIALNRSITKVLKHKWYGVTIDKTEGDEGFWGKYIIRIHIPATKYKIKTWKGVAHRYLNEFPEDWKSLTIEIIEKYEDWLVSQNLEKLENERKLKLHDEFKSIKSDIIL